MFITDFIRRWFGTNDEQNQSNSSQIEAVVAAPAYQLPEWFTESYSLDELTDIVVRIYKRNELSLNDEIALLNVIDFSLFRFEKHLKTPNSQNAFITTNELSKQFSDTIISNWNNLGLMEISGIDNKTNSTVTYLISQNIQFGIIIIDENSEDGRIFDYFLVRHNGRTIRSPDYSVIEELFDVENAPVKTKTFIEV